MSYVEGFLLPVKRENKQAYLDMAATAAPLFMEYGAIEVMEAWGDNLQKGKVTDFLRAVDAQEDENVVFAWILWPSKEVREAGFQKMMNDPRMQNIEGMPFDGQRSIMACFETLLHTKSA